MMPRYIDADKLSLDINDTEFWEQHDKDVAMRCVQIAETADVQEVKHGKWIQDHGWYSHHCSNCGRSTSAYVKEDGDLYDRVFNFCPNCGVKMYK